MPATYCPSCEAEIRAEQVNIREGVAQCGACSTLTRLGDLLDRQSERGVVLASPPSGCHYEQMISGFRATASMRSISGSIGACFVCLFWNGIVSVFVLIALAGLYQHVVGASPPSWFPAPTFQGPPMSLGMTIFLCIFLLPFLLVGAMLALAFAACVFGRISVEVDGRQGIVRRSVGPFGWNTRFDAGAVKNIGMCRPLLRSEGSESERIELRADRIIRFGDHLPDDRRDWLVAVLRSTTRNVET